MQIAVSASILISLHHSSILISSSSQLLIVTIYRSQFNSNWNLVFVVRNMIRKGFKASRMCDVSWKHAVVYSIRGTGFVCWVSTAGLLKFSYNTELNSVNSLIIIRNSN